MPAHGRSADDRPAFDQRQFRDALAQFPTGVTIVCARGPHERRGADPRRELLPPGGSAAANAASVGGPHPRYVGFTANSFNSVSLDPPLILWTIAARSASLATFEAVERYAVNVLSADQADLARRFSRPHADRFAGVAHRLGWSDAPLIDGCVAWLECRHHARHAAGDHVVFVGEVVTVERARGHALVFHRGLFTGTGSPTDAR